MCSLARPVSRRVLLAGLAAGALLPAAGRAEEDHLQGARLRILLASEVGSGTDAIGRAFARVAARLLPATEVTVENLAQASGRLAEKELWQASSDGHLLCFVRPSMKFRVLLDPKGHPYGLDDFTWIGSLSRDRRVLISRSDGTLPDLAALRARAEPAVLAVDNVNSVRFRLATLLNVLLETRILPVPGYGGGDPFLALLGGEVELLFGTFETSLSLLKSGEATALLSLSAEPLPAPFDGVPLLRDQGLAEERRWLWEIHRAEADLGRLVAAAPGLPPERATRLRRLFDAVMADPDFAQDMADLGVLLDPIGGEAVQGELAAMVSLLRGREEEFQAALDCGLERAKSGRVC